ncbi:cation diffusion facilitator family transporter [Pseudomonas profundi]|uniref:cation diffusion facilitator family transporter n=1 Tax=Pseudomonas profundi TaxID=1981513 RepID=UPI001CC26FF8|nr:cation diffusion facilitator family transporter [Pseudomonas profundi]
MDSCCESKVGELAQLRAKQSRVLYIALAVNGAMFLVEFIAGWIANSTALLGDSLDMFGDASVYALTLFVLHRSARARAGAALFKGSLMLLFGMLVVADALRKLVGQEVPAADWMAVIGAVALLANAYCFALLYRHRSDDLNMRSTWLCSRNDLLANTSVIAAAGLVVVTSSKWPDILVGLAMAALFLHSAWQILRDAWREWRANAPTVQQLQPTATCATNVSQVESNSCCASNLPAFDRGSGGTELLLPETGNRACSHTHTAHRGPVPQRRAT